MPKFHQEIIIDILHDYLKSQKRKLKLTRAYCNGLTLLWLHKMSEGKEQWFYDLYYKIHKLKDKKFTSSEEDIEKLLAHIEWLQNPQSYDKDTQQLDVDKLLEIPMNFKLSFLFDDKSLYSTLAEILPRNTLFSLSGPNHTIGIYRRGKEYFLYNPNYTDVKPKVFKDINLLCTEVINSLFKNVHLSSEKLALHISACDQTKPGGPDPSYNKIIDALVNKKEAKPSVERNYSNLFLACESGNIELVKKILATGENINQSFIDDRTALSVAASQNHVKLIPLLLQNGALPNKTNRDQETPLHYAAYYGYDETIRALLEGGADPLKKSLLRQTPLDTALSFNHWRSAAIMLTYIYDPKNISKSELGLLRDAPEEMLNAIKEQLTHLSEKDQERLRKTAKSIYFNISALDPIKNPVSQSISHNKLFRKKPVTKITPAKSKNNEENNRPTL